MLQMLRLLWTFFQLYDKQQGLIAFIKCINFMGVWVPKYITAVPHVGTMDSTDYTSVSSNPLIIKGSLF